MNADRVSSLFWLLLGLVTIYGSFHLGLGTMHEPGSGFLAFLAGCFISCIAAGIFLQSIVRCEHLDRCGGIAAGCGAGGRFQGAG